MAEESKQKEKFKEHIDQYRQADLLRNWLDALENNHDLQLNLQNEERTIPVDALTQGDAEIEYEFDEKKGKHELELSIKWR